MAAAPSPHRSPSANAGAPGLPPSVSVVVVVHDMVRELPRTLATLDPRHQVGVDAGDYEVVVVDNGSAAPVDPAVLSRFGGTVRLHRINPAPPSPARAANVGLALADGALVGVIVDGARMVTPGLVHGARTAARVADRPVITAPAYHLGEVPHMRAHEVGYDQTVEDRLLAEVGWEADGYALFGRATFAGSSHRGWFGPMGESSSLFLDRDRWAEVGGYDEAFDLPGGGLVNHDLYHRACSLPGIEVVQLLGEGTFHQFHGGAATSRRFGWAEMDAQYRALRGRSYRPPPNDVIHLGRLPPAALGLLDRSVRLAVERGGTPGNPLTGGRPADRRGGGAQ